MKENLILDIRTQTYKNETDVKKMIKKIFNHLKQEYKEVKEFPVIQTTYSQAGVSDTIACICGWFVAIEAKYGKNKLSGPQEDFLKEIADAKGLAVCVNETQLEWLLELLENVIKYARSCSEESSIFGTPEGLTFKFNTYSTFIKED